MNDFEEMLLKRFAESGISLNEKQASQFSALTDFMLEYNRNVNLTRITEPSDIIEKHYIDSVLPLFLTDVPRGTHLCDVGAGAGFPSIPMKILRPDLRVCMADSLQKRINYLNSAIALLKLSNCEAVHGRAEDLGKMAEYREQFGMVTARAVANLKILSEYCIPLVKTGGSFLAMKGHENELENGAEDHIKKLGAEVQEIKKYNLPGGDERNLIIIRKVGTTAKIFPRSSKVIQKMR